MRRVFTGNVSAKMLPLDIITFYSFNYLRIEIVTERNLTKEVMR